MPFTVAPAAAAVPLALNDHSIVLDPKRGPVLKIALAGAVLVRGITIKSETDWFVTTSSAKAGCATATRVTDIIAAAGVLSIRKLHLLHEGSKRRFLGSN